MAYERSVGEGLTESEENVTAGWEKGVSFSVMVESLAILSPAIIWKMEKMLSEMAAFN